MSDIQRLEQSNAQLVALLAEARERIEKAHEALCIEEFDADSCPDLESTIAYAIARYRDVCAAEAAAADRVQELRVQLSRVQPLPRLSSPEMQRNSALDEQEGTGSRGNL